MGLRIAPNWFLCADAANDDTGIVFYPCGIPSRNLFVMPVCVRNVHHISQFTDYLVAIALDIPLVVSMILLVKISRK